MKLRHLLLAAFAFALPVFAQGGDMTVNGWQLQDAAKVPEAAARVASASFQPQGWYAATVPGTVLTTLVNNKVYPEPLYGENMRPIPESLNKTSYWYRTTLTVPASYAGRRTWLHFAGVNYAAEVWLDGKEVGTMRGAFKRGDFDITDAVKPGRPATLAVLVSPQPHPGVPHEHTQALGMGLNGGETAIDGPTFLATIGWDWLPAVRDRDTGIWLPVTLSATGPVTVRNTNVVSTLSSAFDNADLQVETTLENHTGKPAAGTLVGTITGGATPVTFRKAMTIAPGAATQPTVLNAEAVSQLHIASPKLWWPNGYGPQNLYHLDLKFETGSATSDETTTQFGIRKVEYAVAGSENLTLVVNGVKVMARGGNWGMDEGMKRLSRERLDAQFHMHQLANLNMIRNWVGQSTSPDFYDLADRYGMMLWDEFFQPNPSDGPNVTDTPTYIANVTDKVLRFRSHPSIVVWCARNEGFPPKELDEQLGAIMKQLDGSRLYQSSSTEGRGVSSGGPYFWREPRAFYKITESFKTETGSMSVPTIESIQGMLPQRDWESIDDAWAQHDFAKGAQGGDKYPGQLAARYGAVRNLADFVRKAQLMNFEAYRAMYESRNATMFQNTTGIFTWMSHPAQPSFAWQLYHYDYEPNASLFAVRKAAEPVHVQFNEALHTVQVVNNRADALQNLNVKETVYDLGGKAVRNQNYSVSSVPASTTLTVSPAWASPQVAGPYFLKLDLADASGTLISSNLYWKNAGEDDLAGLSALAEARLRVSAISRVAGQNTVLAVTVTNPTDHVALMAHLQLRRKSDGKRVLPVFYSDNYLSLAPGETRSLTVEAATRDIAGEPLLAVDGFNINVEPVSGAVAVQLNENAQPMHWPASQIVPQGAIAATAPTAQP